MTQPAIKPIVRIRPIGRAARHLQRWAHEALAWTVVLTLGLLLPLACIAHCLGFEAAPFRIHDAGGLQLFLCDHPQPSPSPPGQAHNDHVLPRPAAEMVLFGALIVLATTILLALGRPRNQASPAHRNDSPPRTRRLCRLTPC